MTSLKHTNLYLLTAQRSEFEILHSLLTLQIKPTPDPNAKESPDHDNAGITALGYLVQESDHYRSKEHYEASVQKLVEMGARTDIMIPFIKDHAYYNDNSKKSQRHLLEFALANSSNFPSKVILPTFSNERLQDLSAELPLLACCMVSNNLWGLEYLLNAGVNPNRIVPLRGVKAHENTFFYQHPIANCNSIEQLSLMLTHNASLVVPDAHGKSGLQVFSQREYLNKDVLNLATEAAMAQRLGLAKGHKVKKADVLNDDNVISALFEAVEKGYSTNYTNILKQLGRGSASKVKNQKGKNLLFPALTNLNYAFSKTLIDQGVNVNEYDNDHMNPLMLFLTQSVSGHNNRDRKGLRRTSMRQAVFKDAKWDNTDALGRPMAWKLWNASLDAFGNDSDRKNYVTHLDLAQKLTPPGILGDTGKGPDPLFQDLEGNYFIQNVINQAIDGPKESSISARLPNERGYALHILLEKTLSHPKLTPELSEHLFLQLFGDSKKPNKYWSENYRAHHPFTGCYWVGQSATVEKFEQLFFTLLEKSTKPELIEQVNLKHFAKNPAFSARLEEMQLAYTLSKNTASSDLQEPRAKPKARSI